MGAVSIPGVRASGTDEGSSACGLVALEKSRHLSAACLEAAAALKDAMKPDSSEPPAALGRGSVRRFDCADPAALQYLSDHGYVVIQNVLDQAEVEKAHDLLWDFLPDATGWRRGKMDTWTLRGLRSCGLPQLGIVKACGAGQSELAWYVRTRPRVKEAFARIWATESLVTSFDGFNVFLPWHHGCGEKTKGGWLHADQGHAKQGLSAIQGFVALIDQDCTTGGLHVIPGSHHCHADWVTAKHPGSTHDFCHIEPRTEYGRGLLRLPQQLVSCRAGDLVLWDSRCVHCNTPALEQPTTPVNELLRVSVYVCMLPKRNETAEDLARRKAAYEEGLSSNHWPIFDQSYYEMFQGNGYGFKVKPLDATDDGRRHLIC
eukprot:TRINITY_DN63346_c0_g1_i1.p1 TRINITY_DN63346_c0_g1~~TRINITY_DN63346_c0_g1_i1.p1  ORF type:complete len:391 (+),score=31.11 TRINITY_DN63346_c0_g1_i1:53-1174(+)